MQRFAMIGAAGFVAPRHMRAIRDTGNTLVAAVDPHDSVGVLDSHFPEARFFTEIERFDRHLEKLRHANPNHAVGYVSVCSPNALHDAHVRLALRIGAHAICEKPLVINPWNLDQLRAVEQHCQKRVYSVLQLRLHPAMAAMKAALDAAPPAEKKEVSLTYITRRGRWYDASWKGSMERSGGVAMNIGIHFFDLLMWLYGPVQSQEVHLRTQRRMAGSIELEHARVRWLLSIDGCDLPKNVHEQGGHAYRSLRVDGEEIDLSAGFTDLHTRVYEDVLAGGGFGIEDAQPGVELVHAIRTGEIATAATNPHELLAGV